MDIPLNVDVHCVDGLCGRSSCVIINPVTQQITHLVIREKRSPHTERLVPREFVLDTTRDLIRLRCSQAELGEMEPFIRSEFIQIHIPNYVTWGDAYMWPYFIPEPRTVVVKHESIPPHELAVRRGAQVEATDGHVGRVDEFLVSPTDGHITHLVLREGHLWGQKEVCIPVTAIAYMEEKTVYLKLDKHSIQALRAIPVRRNLLERS